jgi:hypothetical protein
MLLMELSLQTYSAMHQDKLSSEVYNNMMMDEIDDLPESHFASLREIEKEKLKVAKAYNKNVRENLFHVGELMWKTILPLGNRDTKFGKWSPSWEGPHKVVRIVTGNAYFVETLEGRSLPKTLNGKYLKKYFPSIWQGT